MSIWVVINIIFAWVLWKWAQRDFDNDRPTLGWLNIFFSAWNAAAALSQII